MSSHKAPNTHCVHIFDGEFQLLIRRSLGPTLENGLCCFLYGLWTHTSNAVVHLVVLTAKEDSYAKKHNLDCVGYVAKRYTKTLYNSVLQLTKLSSTREHIIVDVSETTRSKSLIAYGTHHDVVCASEEASSQGHPLQVNILQGESPFRKEFFKAYPELKNTNDYKSETENGYGSHSDDLNSQEHKSPVSGVYPVGKELHEMNRGSKEGNTARQTAFHNEKGTNGHQAKLNQNSSVIQCLKFRITGELGIDHDLLIEERSGKLLLYFAHNYEQWEIVLSQDPDTGRTLAEISKSTELPSGVKAENLQEFSVQNVLDKINEMCQ